MSAILSERPLSLRAGDGGTPAGRFSDLGFRLARVPSGK